MEDKNNDLNKNYLLEVTGELYRLTLLFPKKEPLRYKMRELADDVLANFVSIPREEEITAKVIIVKSADRALEILDSFFDLAKSQNWVSPAEMLKLQRDYSKIRQELIKFKQEGREKKRAEKEEKTEIIPEAIFIKEKEEDEGERRPVSERQQRILDVLREKGKMQVWEIKNLFDDVSKRTLRRDFKNLLKHGLVERLGERNDTFYRINDRTESVEIGQK